jgi:iron(III) transport system substrate-binding protein
VRRYLYLVLFAVVLIAPFVLRLAVTRGKTTSDSHGDGADAPVGRLVIVTPHNQDIRREFARAFDAWHRTKYGRGVAIDYRTPGGTNDIKRLLETTYRAYVVDDGNTLRFRDGIDADIHLVWGGGDFSFDQELKRLFDRGGKRLGVLQPIALDPKLIAEAFPQPALAGVKLHDAGRDKDGNPTPPTWVGVCLSSFGIVYNPDVYRALDLPEPARWHDLTHERLAGMIALADPSHSGSAAVAYMMVLQRAMADAEEAIFARRPDLKAMPKADLAKDPTYQQAIANGWKNGMSELLLIAANARYFTDSASQVPNDVGNGEAAAGVAIDFYGRVYQESVGSERCKFVSPAAATAITPDPIAILYGVKGEPLELATHFVEYLLTPEAQRLWILKPGSPGGPQLRSLRRPPARADVYADRKGWADDVNPFAEAGGFNQRVEWMGLFTDLRPIWAAAWIDGREALKSAYAAVRRVDDATRRAALIAELSSLPIEMKDVAAQQAERKRIETEKPPGVLEEWKARQRIDWARRFRDHYAALASKARE